MTNEDIKERTKAMLINAQGLDRAELMMVLGLMIDIWCYGKGYDNEKFIAELADAQHFVNTVIGKAVEL